MNLVVDRCLPVRRRDGSHDLVAVWQITDNFESNPIVAIDMPVHPRGWNFALTEFLIALYQTILFPEDTGQWRRAWREAPLPEYLKEKFLRAAHCFNMEGAQPFMQDPSLGDDPDLKRQPIQNLLLGGVSENAIKKNTDLFVRDAAIQVICEICAVAALWDFESHAPQGGPGYYVSIGGGGPLRTIIKGETLWETVWFSVIEESAFGMKGRPDPSVFFPWMDHRSGRQEPREGMLLDVYWGMPRRFLINFSDEKGRCDTCGARADRIVRTFLKAPGGCQYVESEWRHPLSPYIRNDKTDWQVRPCEEDVAGYRNWVGLLVDAPTGDGVPAFVVRRWLERDVPKQPYLRLWASGYRCDMASVLHVCEGMMPMVTAENGHRKDLEMFVISLITLSQRGAEQLYSAIKGVYRGCDIPGAEELPGRAKGELWAANESEFLDRASQVAENPAPDNLEKLKDGWGDLVQRSAMSIYNRYTRDRRLSQEWVANFAHKLGRILSGDNPMVLAVKKRGNRRLTDV